MESPTNTIRRIPANSPGASPSPPAEATKPPAGVNSRISPVPVLAIAIDPSESHLIPRTRLNTCASMEPYP